MKFIAHFTLCYSPLENQTYCYVNLLINLPLFDAIVAGIIQKLDYLEELKADAILLSSVYLSNNVGQPDFGYEVINHQEISPIYGTMTDMETLIEAAHNRSEIV